MFPIQNSLVMVTLRITKYSCLNFKTYVLNLTTPGIIWFWSPFWQISHFRCFFINKRERLIYQKEPQIPIIPGAVKFQNKGFEINWTVLKYQPWKTASLTSSCLITLKIIKCWNISLDGSDSWYFSKWRPSMRPLKNHSKWGLKVCDQMKDHNGKNF